MTRVSDDLWLELTQFDPRLADGVWDGTTPLDDAPAWCGELASLVSAARGPAMPGELARETEIVSGMHDALAEITSRRRTRRVKALARVMAAKTVTVLAITTLGTIVSAGLVVSLMTATHS